MVKYLAIAFVVLSFFLSGFLVQNPELHQYHRVDLLLDGDKSTISQSLSKDHCSIQASFEVIQPSMGNLKVPEFDQIILSKCEQLNPIKSVDEQDWTIIGKSIYQNFHSIKEDQVYFFKISQYKREKDPIFALQELMSDLKGHGYHTNLRLIPMQTNQKGRKFSEVNFFYLENRQAYERISKNKAIMERVHEFNQEYLNSFVYIQARANLSLKL